MTQPQTEIPVRAPAKTSADNTVQPFVTIGSNVYMGSGVHVGHNSTIGDHSFLVGMIAIAGYVLVPKVSAR